MIINADHRPPKHTSAAGMCIVLAAVDGLIALQDDKLPPDERRRRTQIFTPAELAAFLEDAKAGEYDHLI